MSWANLVRTSVLHVFVMRQFYLGIFILILSLGVVPLRAVEPVVRSVEITGNRKIETAAILDKVRTQEGDFLDENIIEQDILAIFSLGYFNHVVAFQDDVSGGVKVTFEVVEKPTITDIEYTGFSALDEDERDEAVQVKTYEVLDVHKLNQSLEKFEAKYEEKGYYLADTSYEIQENESKGEAKVEFIAQENDKIKVKTIRIIGNKAISDADLKKVMQTQEGGFFSWLTGSGTYREAVFERDIAALQFYYGTLGYVRARIGKPEVTVSADKKFISITFYVEEGFQYYVGKVDFRGDLLYNRDELLEDLRLVEGEVFNTDTLRRETLRYTEKYADLGYAFANVVPQPAIHDDTRKVDVVFDVDRGNRVYIGKITITGNTRTKDRVIRRQLEIREGELFNGSKKRKSRENVIRLGYFDNVEFHQVSSKVDSQVVDIEIKVKERSTGQLVIGAGYASGDIGFTAQAQLSQNNFLGNGQVASLSAQVLTGRKFYEFNLSFTEPFVGYSLWSLGGDLYHLRRILFALQGVETFNETKTGFKARLGHPVLEYTNLFLTYKLENSHVPESSIIDRTLIPKDSVNGVTSSIAGSLVYDKRDDRFDPKNGLYVSLSSEYAGLGGARNFIKSRGQLKFFHPIVWDFVFRMNVTAANISGIRGKQVPINELFIQGGLFSLRGYDFLSVGPKGRLSTQLSDLSAKAVQEGLAGREIVIGGHNEVLTNLEIEFPLLKEARIRGVLFFDAGNAFNGWFEGQNPALLANVGYGFRWFTPIGPLRFEFGYPIVNPGSPKFYFTIGPPF